MDNAEHASSIGDEADITRANAQRYGPVSGQLISTMTKACRDCFHCQDLSRRLVEGKFICNMQVNQMYLGKLYKVLNRRRADILKEDLLEGTMIFMVVAAFRWPSNNSGWQTNFARKLQVPFRVPISYLIAGKRSI